MIRKSQIDRDRNRDPPPPSIPINVIASRMSSSTTTTHPLTTPLPLPLVSAITIAIGINPSSIVSSPPSPSPSPTSTTTTAGTSNQIIGRHHQTLMNSSNLTNKFMNNLSKLQESLLMDTTSVAYTTGSGSVPVPILTSSSVVVGTKSSPQATLSGCYFLGGGGAGSGVRVRARARLSKRKMPEPEPSPSPSLLLHLLDSYLVNKNHRRSTTVHVQLRGEDDDDEDVNIEDTILPKSFGLSLKRLKLIGNGGHNNYHHNTSASAAAAASVNSPNPNANAVAGNHGIDRQPRFAHHNDLHITQPSSLPTSPVSSPRPLSPPPSNAGAGTGSAAAATTSVATTTEPKQLNFNEKVAFGFQPMKNFKDGLSSASSCTTIAAASGIGAAAAAAASWETKPGIRERNAAMCNNELMADVHFLVSNSTLIMSGGGSFSGEDEESVVHVPVVRYPAHKYVLAVGSSVFYAMFYGPLAETREEITVPDVEPAAFLKMLQYLYSDDINLDEETVLATLNVAKKYIIPQLAKACVSFMESSLTARNACLLLSQSRIFDEIVLMERCWEVIDAQAEKALNADGFLEIDQYTLESILSRETLNCKELTIFNAALQWSNAECERRDIEPTPGNLRAALGSALQLIRVPTMELQEFADGPAQTGIFSLQESHDLFLHFTATTKPQVGYKTTARSGLIPQVCHRFQSSAYRNNQWRYRGRCDSIQFMVDRRIFIVGFGLYGSSGGAATYAVHIELKYKGRILAENDTEFFSDGSSNTFHVYFDQPIQIDPEAYYTASAILDGLELSYFGQEGMTDVTIGPVSFQFQCSSESTNGTGVQGGQIPELIFFGPSPNNPPINTTTNIFTTSTPAAVQFQN